MWDSVYKYTIYIKLPCHLTGSKPGLKLGLQIFEALSSELTRRLYNIFNSLQDSQHKILVLIPMGLGPSAKFKASDFQFTIEPKKCPRG